MKKIFKFSFVLISILLWSIIILFTSVNAFYSECGNIPTDYCFINQDTTFDAGNYYLPNGIVINTSNIVLNCNNSVISGGFSGNGIIVGTDSDINNIEIKNCVVNSYGTILDMINGFSNSKTNWKIHDNIFNGYIQTCYGVCGYMEMYNNIFEFGSSLILTNAYTNNFTNNILNGTLYLADYINPFLLTYPEYYINHNWIRETQINNLDFGLGYLYFINNTYDTFIDNGNLNYTFENNTYFNFSAPPIIPPPENKTQNFTGAYVIQNLSGLDSLWLLIFAIFFIILAIVLRVYILISVSALGFLLISLNYLHESTKAENLFYYGLFWAFLLFALASFIIGIGLEIARHIEGKKDKFYKDY